MSTPEDFGDTLHVSTEADETGLGRGVPYSDECVFGGTCELGAFFVHVERFPCDGSDPLRVSGEGLTDLFTGFGVPEGDVTIHIA